MTSCRLQYMGDSDQTATSFCLQ